MLEVILPPFVKAGIYTRGSNAHHSNVKYQELGGAHHKESLQGRKRGENDREALRAGNGMGKSFVGQQLTQRLISFLDLFLLCLCLPAEMKSGRRVWGC